MTHGEATQFRDGASFRQHLVEKTKALIFPTRVDFSGESELAFRGSHTRVVVGLTKRHLKLGVLCSLEKPRRPVYPSQTELFRDFRGSGCVFKGFHRAASQPFTKAPHGTGIPKKLRQRGLGLDDRVFSSVVRSIDNRPPLLEISHKISQMFLGGHDIELHHGFHEQRPGFP